MWRQASLGSREVIFRGRGTLSTCGQHYHSRLYTFINCHIWWKSLDLDCLTVWFQTSLTRKIMSGNRLNQRHVWSFCRTGILAISRHLSKVGPLCHKTWSTRFDIVFVLTWIFYALETLEFLSMYHKIPWFWSYWAILIENLVGPQ